MKKVLTHIAYVLLSLAVAFLSLILFFIPLGAVIFVIIHVTAIVAICFFICRKNPNSIWYVPILCNINGIIAYFKEPNFWTSPLWIFFSAEFALSLIGAIIGARLGRKKADPNI